MPEECIIPEETVTVIDGGALLHRLPWKRGTPFSQILTTYTVYVKRRYMTATVVFDGYETASTKDMIHQRAINANKE